MKKLMFALAAVAMAAGVQAATIKWASGTGIKPDGSTSAAAGTLMMYVWSVDSTTYGNTSIDSIWGTYSSQTDTAFAKTASAFGGSMGANATATVSPAAFGTTDTYYGIILTMYDSNKDGKVDMYAANKVTATMNDGGTAGGGLHSAKYIGGSSTGGAVTWQNVPEPTSGLLLLLGMAGLALRRRRA